DSPGVGKTAPTIVAAWERHVQTGLPVLITCPAYLVENWAWEISRFAPAGATVTLANGSGPTARREALQADTAFVIQSYANWSAKAPKPKAKAKEQYTSEEIGRAPSELQSRENLVCRLLLEKKKNKKRRKTQTRKTHTSR